MTHRPLLALVALCSTVPLSLAAAPLALAHTSLARR